MLLMRKPWARLRHAYAGFFLAAVAAWVLLCPPPAQANFQDVSCTGTRNGRYTVQGADDLVAGAADEIGDCARGDRNACARAKRMLWDADVAIEQILRESSTGSCKECWLNELQGVADRLARWTRIFRTAAQAAGVQVTINADRTAGVVQGHLDLPGCCPPGTWWNNANSSCQPGGATPPPGTRKNCHVTSSYPNNMGSALCNVWRRRTNRGLVYKIIINPMNPYNPPQGFQLFYSNAPCAQATSNEDAKCQRWRNP